VSAVRGTVINIHQHGATVRLEDGTLAAVPASELAANRPAYVSSQATRAPLTLALERRSGHAIVALERGAPRLIEAAFEAQMNAFLRSSQEWDPADGPPPAERHFIRKKRRAASFEARTKVT